jgi:hypothetical protein
LEQLALTVVRAPDDIARLLRAVAAEEKLLKEGGELPRWRRAALGKGQLSLHRTGVRGGIVPATDSPPQAVVPLLTRVLTNEALERDKLLGGVFGEQGAPTLPSAPETPKQLVESSGALLGSILTQEIEAASPPEVRDPDELTGVIKVILKMVSDSRDPMIASINRFLGSLEGKSFDSFEANQRFTAQVSDLARGLGLRFECQKPGCGAASTLVLLPGNARTGAFAFRHSGTNHGGRATIPSLRLVQEHHSVTS